MRIIGLSIDNSADVVLKHVKAKGWTSVEHYWRGGSTCSKDYGVAGVPHVILIDTAGNMVFIGHPASIDLEASIEKLLKGESLKAGGGTGAAAGGCEDDGDFIERDVTKIREEMANYQVKLDELAANTTIKSNAPSLQRDFVVVIRQTRCDPKTGKFLTEYKNINVLVGAASAVNPIRQEVENFFT